MRLAVILILGCAVFSVGGGCGAPSRRLTVRQVNDPIVNPRGLVTLGGGATLERDGSGQRSSWLHQLFFRYGITDRLELTGLGLGFAFLDDAPPTTLTTAPPKARPPLALAVRGGLDGIGDSSVDGLFLYPSVVLTARKHLGGRVRVGGDAYWNALWSASPRPRDVPYNRMLWPQAGRASDSGVDVRATVQLVDHLALFGGTGVHELHACTIPSCAWASRGGSIWLGPSFRLWNWLTVEVWGFAGRRFRRADVVGDPTMPVNQDGPALKVTWTGVAGDALFSY
ncbi:MAG: hypothetical protein QOI66_2331 [Myxococcales bacterium]|jgi:hypothetical protein|nr:hypothetical protein [Myxococcales bacterium]